MVITYNPNKEIVRIIQERISENGGYCPCRLEHNEDTRCICKEFRDQISDPYFSGFCLCRLYYKTS